MTAYRTTVLIISVIMLFALVPLAFFIFKYTAITSEHIGFLGGALSLLALLIAGWRLKVGLKGRMKRGLGRDVKDHELTSIAAWMEIPDQAARAAKEAEKYDFDNQGL